VNPNEGDGTFDTLHRHGRGNLARAGNLDDLRNAGSHRFEIPERDLIGER
jgi:hypothetical protein